MNKYTQIILNKYDNLYRQYSDREKLIEKLTSIQDQSRLLTFVNDELDLDIQKGELIQYDRNAATKSIELNTQFLHIVLDSSNGIKLVVNVVLSNFYTEKVLNKVTFTILTIELSNKENRFILNDLTHEGKYKHLYVNGYDLSGFYNSKIENEKLVLSGRLADLYYPIVETDHDVIYVCESIAAIVYKYPLGLIFNKIFKSLSVYNKDVYLTNISLESNLDKLLQ